MRGADAERDHKRNDRRDRDRSTCNHAAEHFIFQLAAHEPIDHGAKKRRKDDHSQ